MFYQDFKDTFVCNTQRVLGDGERLGGCFIRISKILLYAIHNMGSRLRGEGRLFYQDFKDTFVCNTQLFLSKTLCCYCCFIRISKILLYAIHNTTNEQIFICLVVLSGFQRYFCMQYTTICLMRFCDRRLFYQDFKDTFVCNTQPAWLSSKMLSRCFIRISKILLYAIHN